MIYIRLKQRHIQMHYYLKNSSIRKISGIILILLFLPLNFSEAKDLPYWENEKDIGVPAFHVHTFQRLSSEPNKNRVDIVIDIMYDVMQFIRQKNDFKASVEVNVSILNNNGELISRKNIYRDVYVDDYALTNSQSDFLSEIVSFELSQGRYQAIILVTDLESKKSDEMELNIESHSLIKEAIGISDLMLTSSDELVDSLNQPADPIGRGRITDPDGNYFLFFDVYRKDVLKPLNIDVFVSDGKNRLQYEDSLSYIGGERISSYFIPLKVDRLNFGGYTLALRFTQDQYNIEKRITLKLNFHGIPNAIHSIDLAIRQLYLIATKKEKNQLLDAEPGEKEKEFIRFWNEAFPTPNSEVNEKMLEYYRRVRYATNQFGEGVAGWKTDRGRVYILYGPPAEVERQIFVEDNSPVEIWYYNHLNRQFVFRDENGFGDYRLVSPLW